MSLKNGEMGRELIYYGYYIKYKRTSNKANWKSVLVSPRYSDQTSGHTRQAEA